MRPLRRGIYRSLYQRNSSTSEKLKFIIIIAFNLFLWLVIRVNYSTVKQNKNLSNTEKTQNERLENINKQCRERKLDYEIDDWQLFNPYNREFPHMYYSDKYKFLYCAVEKSGSTNFKRILLAAEGLIEKSGYEDFERELTHDIARKLDLKDLNYSEIRYRIDNYYKFMIVRDPFERLLSGYKDKLEDPPLPYFAKIANSIKRKVRDDEFDESELKFLEFVQYLSDPSVRVVDEHWRSYFATCYPCHIKYDYIAHLESAEEDLRSLLDILGLQNYNYPSTRDRPGEKIDLNAVQQYYSLLPQKYVRKLYDKYYADFVLFQYTLPPLLL